MLYGLLDSWGERVRRDGSRARNVRTRGSPANTRDDRFSFTGRTVSPLCSVIGQIIHAHDSQFYQQRNLVVVFCIP